jgi:glycosyltransferase involved in cell wall biosynthesis
MKILQVITSLYTGGAEKLIVDIVPRLQELGNEVDVCLFDGMNTPFREQLEAHGCRIYSFSYGGQVYNPLYIPKLWKLMRGYDIVHTHTTAPQFFTAFASKFFSPAILVTTEHSTSNRRRDWKWYPQSIDRWMYRQYEKVINISDQAEENLRQFTTIEKDSRKDNICTIYNGVDVELFHHAQPNKELSTSTQRFVVVMVAGFRYQKDQDTLIRAMSLLPKEEYELWLVGGGTRETILKQKVDDMGMNDNVKMLGVRMDVPSILKAADVVVMSSHFEGLSLSNVEGMSAGKPFVASDVDGLREVTSGYGLMFPHEDAEALANIIRHLHDDKEFYNQTAEKCYERACQFDITKMVNNYNEVYKSLLKK